MDRIELGRHMTRRGYEGVLGGFVPRVRRTANRTPYLVEPGAAVVAAPEVRLHAAITPLDDMGFDGRAYVRDAPDLPPATALAKFAGQLCYLSFGENRTKNRDAGRYFGNIREKGHGSILEHANFSILLYGIGRDVTHELVRHRAGFGFSQVSQRYVGPETLRFVCAPDEDLPAFEQEIDHHAALYRKRIERFAHLPDRKARQQAARRSLPNCVEAPILVTGNVRAWRHFVAARANPHADRPIREAAARVFLLLAYEAPDLFADFSIVESPDGTIAVSSPTPKV